ncbi:MAG TPA: leucine--tRNA ligase, partial [Euryarchaeota archaeon]|nr:leucine--tRNA ligase [Euryarchaeota archaeon]
MTFSSSPLQTGVCALSEKRIRTIEEKWQKKWEDARIFEADADPSKPKIFVTFPYPYVNGDGHLGHLYTQLHAEFYARYKRMKGYNVLFPQGFHATGQPIVAAAKRIREGDKKYVEILKQYGFSDDEIPEFGDPKKWIETFVERWIKALKGMGFSIDWRRTFYTTELNPPYDRFVRWQYIKLKEKGLVVKGTHPVVWCPVEKIPVGDHDRPDEYAGIGPEEIVVVKFRMDDGTVIPTGTYRPETVYGVTNIWINPDAEYIVAEVDGERWVISEWGAKNIAEQLHGVKEIKKIKGEELVGKTVQNPVTGDQVPILPAKFVDPDVATGIVMSVPAHAPYDWIALEDIKKDEKTLEKYGLKEVVEH